MGSSYSVDDPLPTLLPLGTVLGAWRVVASAGGGVCGAVYQAERVGQEQEGLAAIKLALLPRDPRFTREAELLSRVDHPSIPHLLGQGEWQHPTGTTHPYIVMEWVEGSPIYKYAHEHPISWEQVARLLAQVARALEAVHAQGGVHRDVKGGNILVRRSDERAFLTDFGSGKYPGAATLTLPGQLEGTPAYWTSEAMRASLNYRHELLASYVAEPADDLYALGVTAYRLITGQYPELGESFQDGEGIWHLRKKPLPPPMDVNPHLDRRLDAMVVRLLSERPRERGTAKDIAEDLERFADRVGGRRSPSVLAREAKEPVSTASSANVAAPQLFARPWWNWLVLAVAGFALVGESWLSGRGTPEEKSSVARLEARVPSPKEEDSVSLGEDALTGQTVDSSKVHVPEAMAQDTLPEPFPGQARPDGQGRCPGKAQVAVGGGCWIRLTLERDACEQSGYVFTSQCYGPVLANARRRQPTSEPGTQH